MQYENEAKTFGSAVRAARKRKGLTQECLAEKIGRAARHISAIEIGERSPGFPTLCKLIYALNLKIDPIFYPELASVNPDRDRAVHLISLCKGDQLKVILAMLEAMVNSISDLEG